MFILLQKDDKTGGKPLRWLHASILSFPQQIGMKWSCIMIDGENHSLMLGDSLVQALISNTTCSNWAGYRRTLYFIPNPTVVYCFHHSEQSGTVPYNCQWRRCTSMPPWHLRPNKSVAKVDVVFLRTKVQLCMLYFRLWKRLSKSKM